MSNADWFSGILIILVLLPLRIITSKMNAPPALRYIYLQIKYLPNNRTNADKRVVHHFLLNQLFFRKGKQLFPDMKIIFTPCKKDVQSFYFSFIFANTSVITPARLCIITSEIS